MARLKEIIAKIEPHFRAQAERDVESVLRTGARSQGDLRSVLRRKKVPTPILIKVCWVLGRLGDKRSEFPLLGALKHSDPQLRHAAAQSLGEVGRRRAVGLLVAALLLDQHVDVRMAAAHALGSLRDRRALQPLVGKLGDPNEDPRVRGMAAEALASLRDRRAVVPLITALRDASVEVRFWSAFTLGQLGSECALPELERLASEDEAVLLGWRSIKEEAAEAIDAIRGRESSTPKPQD